MSILIRWLRQKPVDMGLQCFQKRISLGTAGQGLITSFSVLLSGLWKYHAQLVGPGPISFRTS